jgi:hypothetical protein
MNNKKDLSTIPIANSASYDYYDCLFAAMKDPNYNLGLGDMGNVNVLPADYECCAICGFDHQYEFAEAREEHNRIFANPDHPEYENEVFFRKELGI